MPAVVMVYKTVVSNNPILTQPPSFLIPETENPFRADRTYTQPSTGREFNFRFMTWQGNFSADREIQTNVGTTDFEISAWYIRAGEGTAQQGGFHRLVLGSLIGRGDAFDKENPIHDVFPDDAWNGSDFFVSTRRFKARVRVFGSMEANFPPWALNGGGSSTQRDLDIDWGAFNEQLGQFGAHLQFERFANIFGASAVSYDANRAFLVQGGDSATAVIYRPASPEIDWTKFAIPRPPLDFQFVPPGLPPIPPRGPATAEQLIAILSRLPPEQAKLAQLLLSERKDQLELLGQIFCDPNGRRRKG